MIQRRRFIDSIDEKTRYAIVYDSYDSSEFDRVWNFVYYLNMKEVVYAITLYLDSYGIEISGDVQKIYKAFNNLTDEDLEHIIDSERISKELKEYCLENAVREYKAKMRSK